MGARRAVFLPIIARIRHGTGVFIEIVTFFSLQLGTLTKI
jgi:hypothetical protein